MSTRYDRVRQVLPATPFDDLARGFACEIADTSWMLGRQWRLGEHLGEDAASPVRVEYRAALTVLDALDGDSDRRPQLTPPEAIVEAEAHQWWTLGRRIRIGRQVAQQAADAGITLPDDSGLPESQRLQLPALPPPYDAITGFDGLRLHRRRGALGLDDAWFGAVPSSAPPDRWNHAAFTYDADFKAGATTLALRGHDGGDIDWYSVDADTPLPAPSTPPAATSVFCSRLRYPGAPNPRWWEIEDRTVDIGGYAPDRSHFATLLLIELIVAHSDDWFTFPIPAQTGAVVTLHDVKVHDCFGDTWTVAPPADGWSLFAVRGLDRRSLVLWPTVATPLTGSALESVEVGSDEDANLLWAVERRAAGTELPAPDGPVPSPPAELPAGEQPSYRYRPTIEPPAHWHPYVVEAPGGGRRFVQARLADLSGATATLAPAPVVDLLRDPAAGAGQPVHQIDPAAVPTDGVRLERRAVLGRRTDGAPVLWTQRRRFPLTAAPAHPLRFDAAESDAGGAP